MSLLGIATVCLSCTTAQGWQSADFPAFDEIMREADLPGSSRQANQPLGRPTTSWSTRELSRPAVRTLPDGGIDQRPEFKRGPGSESTARPISPRGSRFTPSNQRTQADQTFESFMGLGNSTEPNATTPQAGRPKSESRPTDPQRKSRPQFNWPSEFGDSEFNSSQPNLAKPDSASPYRGPLADPFGRRPESRGNRPADRNLPLDSSFGTSGTIYPVGQSRPVSPRGQDDFPRGRTEELYEGEDDVRGSLPMRRTFMDGKDLSIDIEEDAIVEDGVFDWRTIRVSSADLLLPGNRKFQHGESIISVPEQTAYLNLIQEIERRRDALAADPVLAKVSANSRISIWEESFYSFARARQLAWNNGKLRGESKTVGDISRPADPFRKASPEPVETNLSEYSVLDDLRRYPDHFSGRPIVLYGLFSPEQTRAITRTADPTVSAVEEGPLESVNNRSSIYGLEYNVDNLLTKATVLTGSLTSASTGSLLATIDTSGLNTPNQGLQDIRSAWINLPPFPVMVKGWVVKKFKGDRPLVYCESMRLLSPEPHHSLVTSHTLDKQKIQNEEKWLYYETIQQLNQTRADQQAKLGRQNILDRIETLRQEVVVKFKDEAEQLTASKNTGNIDASKYEQKAASLKRRLQQRLDRYTRYRTNPEQFPTYVDLFQNPEAWQGRMVTLQGHVRHAVSYDADPAMAPGEKLHELWLFTQDSQHTPAVIITPELPADFPIDADSIDQVTVTGCFFKRYVYTGQAERRIAPLILAGRIQWSPTVSHVASLVKSGDLSAGSPLAVRARTLEKRQSGNLALIVVSLVIIFGLMVLWGRAQREERDRLRLRDRITDVVEIENGPTPEFASAADEYLNRVR